MKTVGVGLARSRVTAIPSFDTVILSRYQKLFSLSSLTQPAKGVSLHVEQGGNLVATSSRINLASNAIAKVCGNTLEIKIGNTRHIYDEKGKSILNVNIICRHIVQKMRKNIWIKCMKKTKMD